MNDLDFGVRVKSRRRLLKMSQDDLGKAIGISQVAIRKIEAGGQTRHGRKIADALLTTLQWLETGQDHSADSKGNVLSGSEREAALKVAEPAAAYGEERWPLKKATPERFFALTPKQRARADAAIDDLLRGYEAERNKP